MKTPSIEDLKEEIRKRALILPGRGVEMINARGGDDAFLFDFRAILLEARWLNAYAELFWREYERAYPFQVGGLETAGIPLVAAIVMKGVERHTPVNGFYIRKSRKREGLMKYIEGTLSDEPVILVDDLVNSGQTLAKQLLILEEAGKRVSDIFCILAFRHLGEYQFAAEKEVRIRALFTLEDFDLPLVSSRHEIPKWSFQELWRFKSAKPAYHQVVAKSAPVFDGSHVYFGSDEGTFFALNKKDGSIAWEYRTGSHPKGKGVFSSPAVWDNVVYFGAYDGSVYALDTRSGAKRWEFAEADWVGSSPSLAPDLGLLFIGLEFGLFRKRGGIVALSLKSGAQMWGHRMLEFTHSSPLYVKEEGTVVIGGNENTVYCFSAKDGRPLWTFATQGHIKGSFVYRRGDRLIFFCAMDGNIYAIRAADGSLVWRYATDAGCYSTPLIGEDLLYVSSLDKHVYALDCSTGERRWSYATAGRIFANPVLAGGSLWIGSNDGRLYELDPATGRLRSFFQTTERIVNAIAYDEDGTIFLPTFANELYCLKKKSG